MGFPAMRPPWLLTAMSEYGIRDCDLEVVILEEERLNWLRLIITISSGDVFLSEELKTSVGFQQN